MVRGKLIYPTSDKTNSKRGDKKVVNKLNNWGGGGGGRGCFIIKSYKFVSIRSI